MRPIAAQFSGVLGGDGMDVTIILASGERETLTVDGPRATIGRREDCDIRIDSKAVSRMHAELARVDDGWEIRDLGSLNGLQINGRLVEHTPIIEGDEVIIGDARLILGLAVASDSTIIIPASKRPLMWMDPDNRRLRCGDITVGERLAPREYMLLKILADAEGHVVERRTIEEAVWGADAYDDNALHQLVRRTREKIRDDASAPRLLITLPGVGYRLDVMVDLRAQA